MFMFHNIVFKQHFDFKFEVPYFIEWNLAEQWCVWEKEVLYDGAENQIEWLNSICFVLPVELKLFVEIQLV